MRMDPMGGSNYSQQGQPRRRGLFGNVRWWILLLFAGYAAFTWFGGRTDDPLTGKKVNVSGSLQDDAQLGAQAYQEVLADAQQQRALLAPNDQTSQQITAITQRLVNKVPQVVADLAAQHGQQPPDLSAFKWEVNVIQSDQANAFCLPGGKIAVYTGLIPVAQNQDAMAIVIGHEIAHALLRHGAQRMAQQKLVQLGQVAAGMSGMDQATMQALGAGVQYGWVLPYGRDHETEADEIGLMLASAACYNPAEAIPLWERMSQLGGGQRQPEFSSTHPDPANRIQRLGELQPEAKQFYAKYCQGAAN